MNCLKGLYSGAAPLSEQTFNYFLSLDLPIQVQDNHAHTIANVNNSIQELLGSSETCGPQSVSTLPFQTNNVFRSSCCCIATWEYDTDADDGPGRDNDFYG